MSAIPPTFAGVTRLTNDDAIWAARLGPNGRCSGTPPDERDRGADVGRRSTSRRTPPSHRQVRGAAARRSCRRRRRAAGAGRRTRRQRGDHEQRPRPHADQLLERRRALRRSPSAMPSRSSREQRLGRLLAGRGRQRERLQVGRRAASSSRSEARDRRGERAVRPRRGSASETSSSARSIACVRGVGRLVAEPEVDDHRVGRRPRGCSRPGATGARAARAWRCPDLPPDARRAGRRRSLRAAARRAARRRRTRARAPSSRRRAR